MIPVHIPQSSIEKISLDISGLEIIVDQVSNVEILWQQLLALGPAHPWVVDERIPYWAEIWPSAIAMSRYLVERKLFLKDKSVLEIGCGLGIPGIVAGKLGANVILSDYQQDALDFAAHNWSQNLDVPSVCVQLDWREAHPEFAAEILIASDVAYEKRAFAPLIDAFSSLVKAGGTIFLAEPGRDFASAFLNNLSENEFEKSLRVIPVEMRSLHFRINILELKKKG